MQSKAPDVSTYLQERPGDRRVTLERLRQLCLEFLKGYEECMAYGMPAYKRDGAPEVAFASQKQYVSLYVMKKDVVERHRKALSGCEIGKGCIRFRDPEKIDFAAVADLLRDTAKSNTKPC